MTVTEQELRLGPLAKEAVELSESADPRQIARETVDTLPEFLREELILKGWEMEIHTQIRAMRARRGVTKSPKWDSVRQHYEAGVLERRYPVNGSWKLLAECTPENVFSLVEDYERRAEINTREAQAFRKLHSAMKRAKATVVAELGEQKVAGILDA